MKHLDISDIAHSVAMIFLGLSFMGYAVYLILS